MMQIPSRRAFWGGLCGIAAAAFCVQFARAEAVPSGPIRQGTLQLRTGDYIEGDVRPSAKAGVLCWQGAAFASPFEFEWEMIRAVQYPAPDAWPVPESDYCFELSGGDVLFGSLVGLDLTTVEVDAVGVGRVHLRRRHVERISRWRGEGGLIFLGPNGLAGWNATPGATSWAEAMGRLSTNEPGAFIDRDFGLPARVSIEVGLSWRRRADFVLALGVDRDGSGSDQAFRLEAWERDLVIIRETQEEADVASLQPLKAGEGSASVQIFLDQEAGRCVVLSPSGLQLADLIIKAAGRPAMPCLRLTNRRGDVRLDRLRILPWNGAIPSDLAEGKTRIQTASGEILNGALSRFDSASREFIVQSSAGETRIAATEFDSVSFPAGDASGERNVRVVYHNSTKLSGRFEGVTETGLLLTSPGISERLELPLEGLSTLGAVRGEGDDEQPAARTELTGRRVPIRQTAEDLQETSELISRLETDGAWLLGRLVSGTAGPESSCLAWLPKGSATASALKPGASGKIVYRSGAGNDIEQSKSAVLNINGNDREVTEFIARLKERKPQKGAPRRIRVIRNGRIVEEVQLPDAAPAESFEKALHLRTGDTIACEVTGIDENGVSFTTPHSEARFVPHEKVQAVDLGSARGEVDLTDVKRARLLTLPRMQRNNPPTHLIRAQNGDYLRGRILSMDDRTLRVQIRLEEQEIPRERVAQIIWLHNEEPADAAQTPSTATNETRVQALGMDGKRLTIVAERCDGETLFGKSDVLGECRVELRKVAKLFIGTAIEEEASRLAYQQWKLTQAVEPKFVQGGGEASSGDPGIGSALVGQPAPDFDLEMIDGSRLSVAGRRGKVLVLEFFATWCGPCVESLPQVDAVSREFAGRGVDVVAVNLEEGKEQIEAMFERHQLTLPAALDRDGVAASRYSVTSIPQTVVIDREGTVVRHFIGGGPRVGEQLRAALLELLGDAPEGAQVDDGAAGEATAVGTEGSRKTADNAPEGDAELSGEAGGAPAGAPSDASPAEARGAGA